MTKKFNSGCQLKNKRDRKMFKAARWARSSTPPSGNRRRQRKNNRESELEIKHMILWNDQNEDQQPYEFQLNQGNRQSNRQHYQKTNRGLSDKQLNLLPEFTADDSSTEENCAVCLETFEKNQSLVVLICNHEFHYKCCVRWLKDKKTCPICRCDQSKYQWCRKNESAAVF